MRIDQGTVNTTHPCLHANICTGTTVFACLQTVNYIKNHYLCSTHIKLPLLLFVLLVGGVGGMHLK